MPMMLTGFAALSVDTLKNILVVGKVQGVYGAVNIIFD